MLRRFLFYLLLVAVGPPASVWADDTVSAYWIQLPESVPTVFVAETATAKFHRFRRVDDGVEHMGSQYMSIGLRGAGKQRSGDKRTPLGAYFVTESLDTSKLHEKYGITAFPLDYPNAWDRRLQRSGDGIWVHGVDPNGGTRPPLDTDGCIALPNEELAKIVDDFAFNQTPVLVTQSLRWSDAETVAALRLELDGAIRRWADSLSDGDIHGYLSSYHDDFVRWQMAKSEWTSFVAKTMPERTIDELDISDMLLLAYPEENGLYLSRFQQHVVESDQRTTTVKRLYWRRDSTGVLRIIAETNG